MTATTHPRLHALCATGAGLDVLSLVAGRIPIAGVIGLTPRPATDHISGLVDPRPFCESMGVPYIPVTDYRLAEPADRQCLEALEIDVLLAFGWQRLVPDWLIRHTRRAVLGVHGSADGITAGRGRSPQNWALILGRDSFELALFLIDPGIDSGDVLATRRFELTRTDTIATSYARVALATADMILSCAAEGRLARGHGMPQTGSPRYLPQRRPEDGALDWNRPADRIHDFIRALTRPYPGAFSALADSVVRIWASHPLGDPLSSEPPPGTILTVTSDNHLLIAANPGIVMVTDWSVEGPTRPQAGLRLNSVDFVTGIRTIAERHQDRYPDLPLARDILDILKEPTDP